MHRDEFPQWFLSCPSKKYLGLDCPGCGMQRAVYSAVKGDFKQSIHYNPGALPFLFLIVFTGLHLWLKFRNGPTIIVWGFISTAVLMWTAFLIKVFS